MQTHLRAFGLVVALGAALTAGLAQSEPPQRTRFTNLSRTYSIDLPAGFRQLAPNEALELGKRPGTPAELRSTSPRAYYAVGPVDRWLAGEVASPWLYVMEQDSEWHIDGDFESLLRERWQENGREAGIEHEIADVREATVGPLAHEVRMARRTSTPRNGRSVTSLDVYAPTGGRQITLSFYAWTEDYERWAPEFEAALATLTFSRPSRGEQSLSDRLWTPLLTGGLVGLVLLVLYKHTRRSR